MVTKTVAWEQISLGSIANFRNGLNYSKENFGRGIKVINVKDFKDYSVISYDELDEIEPQGILKEESLLKENDMLFVRSNGNRELIGRSIFLKNLHQRVSHSAFTIRTRITSPIADPRFYSYVFKSSLIRQVLSAQGGGTNISNLNQDILLNLKVPLPPLETQKKIAAILSSYDDLIENNTRRIEILEDMARGLYREWFVNFRFPGHEEVEMVDSSMGQIPAEWQGKLEDCLTLQRGFDLPNSQRRPGSIPIYASTGITGTHDEAKVRGPGVVTGRSGSLGTVVYVQEDYWPLNTALWVKAFKRSTPLHSFFLLSDMGLEQYNSGAAVPTLNRNDVHGVPVAVPPQELLMQFDEKVGPMYLEIRNLTRRNNNLRRTRDLLLPKLISGEIDVSTLEVVGVTGPETAIESV
jgi:type I restriction enzyme, S subunit